MCNYCSKCSNYDSSFSSSYLPYFDQGNKYCSKYGIPLLAPCLRCHGSGRVTRGYCSKCGRELEKPCPTCRGKGEVKAFHFHNCSRW